MICMRIENIRKKMEKKGIDALLLVSDSNRNYMSGFTGNESFSVITLDRAIFITDSRYTQQAREEVKEYEISEYKGSFSDYLSKLAKELNINKLGFEDDIISYSQYLEYEEKLSCELVPIKGMVQELRIIKDNDEIKNIKKAASIADKAFKHMLTFIKASMSEKEVELELEFTMKKLGASGLSFTSIVASGVRSSLPHGTATDKIIQNGEFLTMDFGCVYNEYCSDMTRTLVIGEPNDKMKDMYEVVLAAQKKALKTIKPGLTGKEVDKVARDYIQSKGYGEYFGHGLGHGVGRVVHEMPRISPTGNEILKPGMVITDEPGVYIPNFGGLRIEDLILVTEEGCEILSKSPKELICIK
ncbi:Xaa-Pro peptidase family protein [Clostridium aestuarii]|uniref:Xaa-Pro peptidase family protein n=1 Tax=Clostridium aestuarii TaxID=338193 RepID=A0ABT4CXN8_9CLOT|nr:Xaa-Pro peptidase family protein [Clostridium aestuarii]MCY6483746.1 Xaa-Pro peptidase family protein [Clostridium aestuarii]